MKNFIPQNFNDLLCCWIMVIIPLMWILDSAFNTFKLNDIILGATISTFTLVVQYYFRKKASEGGVA